MNSRPAAVGVPALLLLMVLVALPISAAEIHEAAKSGDLEKIRTLVDADKSLLLLKDEQGKTPLHWATGRGQLEAIRLLIDTYKMDVNTRNANEGTPVHVAASQAQTNALKLLVETYKADVNAKAKDGATPLHFAAIKSLPGHLEAVRYLLDHGADVNAETHAGATPLMYARARKNEKTMELLRKRGGVMGAGKMEKMRPGDIGSRDDE